MLIVGISDGLGNQMFHYALYRSLLEKGKMVKMDIDMSWYGIPFCHNGYELSKIFFVRENLANEKEIKRLGGYSGILGKICRKLKYPKSLYIKRVPSNTNITYFPEVMELDNKYLYSGWQSEKYFSDIQDIIRNEFSFKLPINEMNQIIIDKIKSTEAVSIHVRRGDYINNLALGEICDLNYYNTAIEHILKIKPKAHFFVFSNDADWCKKNLTYDNMDFVDVNFGKDSYRDMQLMSLCKHNIIANSSFSWWGAWLNCNPQKIVVAPNKWFNGVEGTYDIIPKEWYKIKV